MMLRSLICFLSCVFTTDGYNDAVMENIFRSIERTLQFYESNKILVTLDDVFALRLLEGQILVMNNQLVGSVSASNDVQTNILPRLTTVYHFSRNLSSAALNLLYRNFQQRSLAKSYIYQWPWTSAATYRHLDSSLKWPADTYRPSVNEYSKYEDSCFAELMKSGFEQNCRISSVCTTVMFSRGQSLRDIEQQLLYTLLVEQSGCISELNLHLLSSSESPSVEKWQAELCTNIFFTVSDSISKNGNIVPPHLEGVFLNMALLCPFVGYFEFLHMDWLRQILSWQTSFGCWGSAKQSTEYVGTRVRSAGRAAARRKKRGAEDEHSSLKSQANSAVNNFLIKRGGMKRLQGLDNDVFEQFLKLRRKQELADAEQSRTAMSDGYGVTSMTTVFVRRRPLRNKGARRTKDQLGFASERLLLTENSVRVHSPEGCVAPLTAIAIGALSQYLRFCLLAPLSQLNPADYLFGTNYILSPDKLSSYADEAGLRVKEYMTQSRPNAAASAVVGFDIRNLDHNFAEPNRKYEVKNEVNRVQIWADDDSAKLVMKADDNPVDMVLDQNDPNDGDGGRALEAQDEEEDAGDYSYLPAEVIKVADVSQDFKGKGSKDRGVQEGGYDGYYDNMDDDNGGDERMAWRLDHDRSVKFTHSSSHMMTAVNSRFDAAMTASKTYAVVLAIMFLFVCLLYKSFDKRRTGLLHRYNSHWK